MLKPRIRKVEDDEYGSWECFLEELSLWGIGRTPREAYLNFQAACWHLVTGGSFDDLR